MKFYKSNDELTEDDKILISILILLGSAVIIGGSVLIKKSVDSSYIESLNKTVRTEGLKLLNKVLLQMRRLKSKDITYKMLKSFWDVKIFFK